MIYEAQQKTFRKNKNLPSFSSIKDNLDFNFIQFGGPITIYYASSVSF